MATRKKPLIISDPVPQSDSQMTYQLTGHRQLDVSSSLNRRAVISFGSRYNHHIKVIRVA